MDSQLAASFEPSVCENARVQRRYYRQRIRSLAYVNLDHANGGIIRDVSEAGIAVQAVAPMRIDERVRIRFELLAPRTRIEAAGRVAWSDASGQAGMEFIGLDPGPKRQLKDWIFTQLLAMAHQSSGTDSIFVHRMPGEEATELRFSSGARSPIRLSEASVSERFEDEEAASLLGINLTPALLTRSVDVLVLLCAVLLFAVLSMSMTSIVPTWPLALALALGVSSAFAGIYYFLFRVWTQRTPGEFLASIALPDEEQEIEPERFR